jgi:hypothetical protein
VSLQVIVYVLTALSAVVVVLTRLRLRAESGAGRVGVPQSILNIHTGSGTLGLLAWVTFLVAPADSAAGGSVVGILGLGLLWVTTVCGLLILTRWLPTRGRHASGASEDEWSEGPGLSVLAHVGLLVGVCVFTGAYLFEAV